MKMIVCGLSGVALLALVAGCAAEKPEPAAPRVTSVSSNVPGSVKRADTVTMSAVVEDVDVANRRVVLRTADGEKRTLNVGPEVRNLAQVKKGDMVNVAYLQAVAIEVKKPGEGELGAVAAEQVERAAPGEKPAGAAAQTVVVTAKIAAIDRDKQTVTLVGKEGNEVTIDVRNPHHFDAIAVGDLVQMTYTESVAIAVEPVGEQ